MGSEQDRHAQRRARFEVLVRHADTLRKRALKARRLANESIEHANQVLRESEHAQERLEFVRRADEALRIAKASVSPPEEFAARRLRKRG